MTEGPSRGSAVPRWAALASAVAGGVHLGTLAPLTVYIGNRTLTRATLGDLAPWMLIVTAVATVVLAAVFVVLRRWPVVFAVALAVVFYLYVQFYLFTWNYGPLAGAPIEWSKFRAQAIVEIVTLVALVALGVLGWRRVVTLGPRVLVAAVLLQAIVAGLAAQRPSTGVVTTAEHSNTASIDGFSRDKNVILLILDTLQGDYLERYIRDHRDFADVLKGFTVYRNASGLFPYTSLSVPAINTGVAYEPGQEIQKYFKSIAKRRLVPRLRKGGFDVSQIRLEGRADYVKAGGSTSQAVARIFDVALFRQVPHLLKPAVLNDYAFVIGPHASAAVEVPDTDPEVDLAVLRKLAASAHTTSGKPQAKVMHLWGVHPPTRMSAGCELQPAPDDPFGSRQSYGEQLECILNEVALYLKKLQKLGVYDDTMLVITGDHGSKQGLLDRASLPGFSKAIFSAAHPGIAVKPLGATGAVRFSDDPVMVQDEYATILEELGVAKSDVGYDMVKGEAPAGRVRPFSFYESANDVVAETLHDTADFEIRGNVRKMKDWTALDEPPP